MVMVATSPTPRAVLNSFRLLRCIMFSGRESAVGQKPSSSRRPVCLLSDMEPAWPEAEKGQQETSDTPTSLDTGAILFQCSLDRARFAQTDFILGIVDAAARFQLFSKASYRYSQPR
jgi:hypothetical protein